MAASSRFSLPAEADGRHQGQVVRPVDLAGEAVEDVAVLHADPAGGRERGAGRRRPRSERRT